MPSHPIDPPAGEPERHVEELQRQARQLAEGRLVAREAQPLPVEIRELFWRQVVEYERAPWTTYYQQLQRRGMRLPDPDTLTAAETAVVLGALIRQLAELRVFLAHTNHLDDRQLLRRLVTEILHEPVKLFPVLEQCAYHVDLTCSGEDEDTTTYLRYYADAAWRAYWQSQFPDCDLPDHEDPPHDRDRHLPQSDL